MSEIRVLALLPSGALHTPMVFTACNKGADDRIDMPISIPKIKVTGSATLGSGEPVTEYTNRLKP